MKPSITVTLTVDIGDGGKPSLLVTLPGTDGDKFNIPLDESPAMIARLVWELSSLVVSLASTQIGAVADALKALSR